LCFSFKLAEEVDNELSVADLVSREADAPIFGRLCLSYGKAVPFKKEFGYLRQQEGGSIETASGAKTPSKPSMADLSKLNPEMRQLYLTK
jgi:hypothetical protein